MSGRPVPEKGGYSAGGHRVAASPPVSVQGAPGPPPPLSVTVQPEDLKFYAKEIATVRGRLYAVHRGVQAGTVRIVQIGQPGREIVLDPAAAIQLRDALSDFLIDPATYG